jgi:hypothetical protein
VRILFCGDRFPASHSLLKERLRAGEDEITVCNGANLREALSKADVVIPALPQGALVVNDVCDLAMRPTRKHEVSWQKGIEKRKLL